MRSFWENLKPSRVLSRAGFTNGIATAMAMGCSTNAIIHLVAISRRAGRKPDSPNLPNMLGRAFSCDTFPQAGTSGT